MAINKGYKDSEINYTNFLINSGKNEELLLFYINNNNVKQSIDLLLNKINSNNISENGYKIVINFLHNLDYKYIVENNCGILFKIIKDLLKK